MEKEFSKNLISRVPIALLMAAVIILALAYGSSLIIKIFILAITILAALELLNFIGRSVFNILFLVSALVGILSKKPPWPSNNELESFTSETLFK